MFARMPPSERTPFLSSSFSSGEIPPRYFLHVRMMKRSPRAPEWCMREQLCGQWTSAIPEAEAESISLRRAGRPLL